MEVITGNVQLYEEHQPTVNALTQESLRLREELLAFAKAYAQMGVSDPDGELLKFFARDIHVAHQEFMSRLSFLADKVVRSKADALKTKENEIDKFKHDLNDLLAAVRNKIVWPNSGIGVLATLQQFCEWYKGDCTEIEKKLEEVEKGIKDIENNCQKISNHLGNIQQYADKWNRIFLCSHHKKIIDEKRGISDCKEQLDEVKLKLDKLREDLSSKKDDIVGKNEKFDNLIASGSELSNLIVFLENTLQKNGL